MTPHSRKRILVDVNVISGNTPLEYTSVLSKCRPDIDTVPSCTWEGLASPVSISSHVAQSALDAAYNRHFDPAQGLPFLVPLLSLGDGHLSTSRMVFTYYSPENEKHTPRLLINGDAISDGRPLEHSVGFYDCTLPLAVMKHDHESLNQYLCFQVLFLVSL